MAEERTPFGTPRRKPLLIGLAVAMLLAVGVVLLLTQGDDVPPRTRAPGDEPVAGDDAVAEPDVPSFRFSSSKRVLVPTRAGPIKKRHRAAGRDAADAVRDLLTDLYTEAYLDPGNWRRARYEAAFRSFAGGAVAQAEERAGLLTAGTEAGERFDEILPISGRLITRILLDRAGAPTLVVGVVRFSAKGLGPEPTTLRSNAQFFFERVDGRWKIVSFQVTRDDEARGS